MQRDEAAKANEALWNRKVEKGCGYTIPWLDLDPAELRRFARGELDFVPRRLSAWGACPGLLLGDVEDKDVLCLGAGGGQQSAVYGLLGTRVTVVDLCQGQLEADRRAAEHYGYEVQTLHTDMRDLSRLDEESFDVVYATGLCYVPDINPVYAEIARVLKPGGLVRIDGAQPAVSIVAWDGSGYRIAAPYAEKVNRREDGGIEYRHYMDDVFNGLLDVELSLVRVFDLGRDDLPDPEATPGNWPHEMAYVGGGFIIVATKSRGRENTPTAPKAR